MHPDLGEPVFAQWYGSEDMLDVSAALMGVTRAEMQFGKSPLMGRALTARAFQPPRQPPREGLRPFMAP